MKTKLFTTEEGKKTLRNCESQNSQIIVNKKISKIKLNIKIKTLFEKRI